MAALSADRQIRSKASVATRLRTANVEAGAVIYFGALVAKNAAGNIVPASDTAALKVVGVSQTSANNSAGAAGALQVQYVTCIEVELDNAGGAILQASLGTLCTVVDDHSVSTAAVTANDVLAGLVAAFSTTKVWVFVDEVIGQTG